MKKSILCMMLLIVWCPNASGFAGGDGSINNPWQVETAADLDDVKLDLTAHYIQIAHIDLSGTTNWEPIAGGGSGDRFTGSYDGDGYKIENLTINRPNTINVGLFGHIGEGAVIKNVVLDGVNVTGARGTGSLIGRVTGNTDTLIEGCSAVGNTDTGGAVVGDGATGGLVGSHNSATETPGGTDNPVISQCFADIDVSLSSNTEAGKDKFGGLAGCSQKGTIMDSYARGSVTVNDTEATRIGGLAGCILYRGEIIRSYSTGRVDSTGTNVGGLVGNLTVQGAGNDGVVTDSYWDVEASDMTTSAGGIGKTTDEMKNQATFANWDFNTIWSIDPDTNVGYPYLLWQDFVQPDTGDPPEPPEPPDVPISRRAIMLDGVIDRVHVPHDATLNVNGDTALSVEAWVKKDSEQSDEVAVVFKDRAYGLYLENGNEPAFTVYEDNTTQQTASSGVALTPGRWYHLAGTFDGTNIRIYINGYLYNTYTYSAAITINDDAEPIGIGADLDPDPNNTGKFFRGTIDEVRIWSSTQTETRLRETMCKKITDTEALQGYWRLDEVSGQTYEDNSGNDNTATIYSGVHICSSAPVGDDSGHDYTGTNPEDFSVTLTQTDTFESTGDSGDWSTNKPGLQVYWVEHAPDDDGRSPMGWRLFRERGHFGAFVTGGEEPTYKMSYEYDPAGIREAESLKVAFRNGNCAPWKDVFATLENGALTKENLTGTEFILGTDMEPRNAIEFDGTDDYVGVTDDTTLDLTNSGTLEAWINIATLQDAGIISKGDATDGYALGINASGNVVFSLYNSGASTTVASDNTLSTATWYHIAGTWDGTDMNVYINGILDPNSTGSTQTAGNSGTGLAIGSDTTNYFQGVIDEVRIWDTARTQTQIRDTMCRKITSSDTGFANLTGYWRFDRETTSATCPDYSANSNDGTMTGFDDVLTARVCSSAPIGDGSSWDYYDGGPGPVSAQLAHPDGDYMFATEYANDWGTAFSGLHVYRVDEAPVYPPDIETSPYAFGTVIGLTPPSGWSSIDYSRYWGVYVTDRDSSPDPQYDVEYHYCADATGTSCNPSVPDDESVLALAKRAHYCDREWVDTGVSPDTTNNTLTKSGETDTEYVLGGTDQPLAISLISFTADADKDKECIKISWETATEVETVGYYLWRSLGREGEYEKIEDSFVSAKSVNSTQGAKYAYRDCDVYLGDDMNYYYKLEEVDMDDTRKNPFYGPIGPVSKYGSADQLTSARDRSTSSGSSSSCFVSTLK